MIWQLYSLLFFLAFQPNSEWGFFAHAQINELAVYTLPIDMKVFFSPQQDYLKRHATDADKRRYASAFEATRHFIDLDQYGEFPYSSLKRDFKADLYSHSSLEFIQYHNQDTLYLPIPDSVLNQQAFINWFDTTAIQYYYETEWAVPLSDTLKSRLGYEAVRITDHLTPHGVLPYNLERVYKKLVRAFYEKKGSTICRYAADLGHYLGDATVPLHTCSNYNGQKTGQYGIHAFWESRIPELFFDQYHVWVGGAEYIPDVRSYIWEIVLESNALVSDVLSHEKVARERIPDEEEYTIIERSGRLVQAQSDTLTILYNTMMGDMVENRFRRAILAVGSLWYSAWVDAGMPDLTKVQREMDQVLIQDGKRRLRIRKHPE